MYTVEKSEAFLKTKMQQFPELVMVLGTGWKDVLNDAEVELEIPYGEIFGEEASVPGHEGRYVYVRGPHFETFADKMVLRQWGADVVGMSTVPETIMANYLGVATLGLACVTNLAFVAHSHEDVQAESHKASQSMSLLLQGVIKNFG